MVATWGAVVRGVGAVAGALDPMKVGADVTAGGITAGIVWMTGAGTVRGP